MTNQREIKKKNISRESYLSTTIATFPSFLLFNLLVLVMVFLPMLTSMPSPGNNNYNNKRNPSYILSLTKIGLGIYLLFLAIQIFQGRNDDKDGDGNGDMKRRITRYATMHGKSYPMVVKLYDVRRERMESDCENAVDKLIESKFFFILLLLLFWFSRCCIFLYVFFCPPLLSHRHNFFSC